ncbi:MAG: hypothetical protein Q9183_003409 [Haloplaca sp. 2 TL-2023]
MDAGGANPNILHLDEWQQEDNKWSKFFSTEQTPEENARSYAQRTEKLARTLTEAPAEPSDFLETLIFFRVRNGLKTEIKDVLSKEFFQPTNLEDLLRGVDKIERMHGGSARLSQPDSETSRSTPVLGAGGAYLEDAYQTSQAQSNSSQPPSTKRQKFIPTHSTESRKPPVSRGTVNSKPQTINKTLNKSRIPNKTAPATIGHPSLQPSEQARGIKRSQDYDYDEADLQAFLHARDRQNRGIGQQIRGQNQRFYPLTPTEKEHRLANDLCFRCGREGHMKLECPLGVRRGK